MNKTILFISLITIISFGACKTKKDSAITPTVVTKTIKPIHLNKELFIEKVWDYEKDKSFNYKGEKPAIIDFYADWCGPCKRIAPILNELQNEYGDKLVIYKIDTEQNRQLASLFQVRSIPALLFIPVSSQPQMAVGAQSKARFKQIIKDFPHQPFANQPYYIR